MPSPKQLQLPMHTNIKILAATALCASLSAQNSLVFTGRFPFQSLDTVNERTNGSINKLEEFDFSVVTPSAAALARTLQPATAHQAYIGDSNSDGNYTKFAGFKTYFQNIQMGGLFVKAADKGLATADKVWFTVRSNAAPLQIEAFTNGGTSVAVIRPGDFVRFKGSGNLEYFITQDLIDIAAGPAPVGFTSVKGASAMCQDSAGNLYYSPSQGGQWINGMSTGTALANDGAIVLIPASAITYDASGNVASVTPNSARILVEENTLGSGPAPISVRQMVLNSQCMDRLGNPLAVAGVFGRVSGLDLDPNGGTFTPNWPDATGAFVPAPNLVFTSDAGSYAGTIFSTNLNGTPAVINGITCASTTIGVAATGSWLGVRLDVTNFQPSLMGLVVVGQLPYEPLTLDMPNFGAINSAATQANIEIDVHGLPTSFTVLLADFNIAPLGGFAPSVPTALVPLTVDPFSHAQTFPIFSPTDLGLQLTDGGGYASYILANPHIGQFAGIPMILQCGALDLFGNITISNPVQAQFK